MPADRNDDPLQKGSSTRPAVEETDDANTLRLFGEEVSVAKEILESGRVRISKRTRENEALIDENLARERVEIETIPVGQRIYAMPEVRHEGDTTIVPIVEEVLFTERRLMLKEEIRIKRVRSTERYQDKVTLRRQEAVINRVQGATDQPDATSDNKIRSTDNKE